MGTRTAEKVVSAGTNEAGATAPERRVETSGSSGLRGSTLHAGQIARGPMRTVQSDALVVSGATADLAYVQESLEKPGQLDAGAFAKLSASLETVEALRIVASETEAPRKR